jgi:hypothetical protein
MVVSNSGGGRRVNVPYSLANDDSIIGAGSTMDFHMQMVNTATNDHHHNFGSSSNDHHMSISESPYVTPSYASTYDF